MPLRSVIKKQNMTAANIIILQTLISFGGVKTFDMRVSTWLHGCGEAFLRVENSISLEM